MIIYFSGTGNTRHVAQCLAEILGDTDVREMSPSMLLSPEDSTIEIADTDTTVIWAFPTYSWGIPPVVDMVMKKVALGYNASNATHIMLTTCGDDMAYTDRQWRKNMAARNLKCAGAYAVVMPNTYVLMKGFDVDSTEIAESKIKSCRDAIEQVATAINNNSGDIPVRLSFSWVKSNIIYPWFKRYAMSPKPFHSNNNCTGCGICANKCPMQNITICNGKPLWADRCAMCLRCYHICPHHAVAYGKATAKKGQYLMK